ncbi:hypothetical protein JL720_1653 [Aureococcus anophagefferens]|nr:hypothetical protein JL720_1653 [Aureococcus anophagefferens]
MAGAGDGAVETSNGSWLKKRKRSDGDEAPEDGDGDVLLLNVGGRSFATTYGTVRSAPGYLANLFKEGSGFRAARDADGRFFIDKNPDTFAVILEWLRDEGRLLPPAGLTGAMWLRLRSEADFFGLQDLREQLGGCCRRLNFDGITLEQAERFENEPLDLVRVGFPVSAELLKDINVENELEIFYETGVPAHLLGPGLSAFGSHLDNGRGNLRRGECGYIGNLMTHANGIIINVTKNPYWTGIHKARIERVRAGLESYMDTDGTWEWSSRWDPTKLMTA